MKKYSLKYYGLNINRWYEYYVEIKPIKVDNFNEIVPYIYFKEKIIIETIKFINIKKNKKIFFKRLN